MSEKIITIDHGRLDGETAEGFAVRVVKSLLEAVGNDREDLRNATFEYAVVPVEPRPEPTPTPARTNGAKCSVPGCERTGHDWFGGLCHANYTQALAGLPLTPQPFVREGDAGNAKLDVELVRLVRRLDAEDKLTPEVKKRIAADVGCTVGALDNAVKRVTWDWLDKPDYSQDA